VIGSADGVRQLLGARTVVLRDQLKYEPLIGRHLDSMSANQ
jgi:hypothetical protein